MNRTDLLCKRKKEIYNRITLVLTYHPALTIVFEVLQKEHRHMLKYQRLTAVLPLPRLAPRNAKTLKDHLFSSKLKTSYDKHEVTICGRKNCEIYCHTLHQGDVFESPITRKPYKVNFSFNSNSRNVVFLLTCKNSEKHYFGSTIAKFKSSFNQ